MKSVTKCLQEAGFELKAALEKLESGQPLTDDDKAASPSAFAAGADNDVDPDDSVAAFFAQQAQQQRAESKLPINAWAKTIHATSSNVQLEDKVSCRTVGDTTTTDQTLLDASKTKARVLYKIFEESAYAE